MDNKRVLQVGLIIILAAVAWFWLPHLRPLEEPINVTDFSSCQQAGGNVLQTDPITCKMPDGRTFAEEESAQPDVILDQPKYGDLVKSPLGVMGRARGTWFFEASMPVTLKDDTGKVLFQGPVQAIGDWMTTDYVPFAGTIPFDPGTAQYGVLIINKDNPSGNPDLDSSIAIPVRFK